MVFSRLARFALAFGLGLILLVVSCAPAAEPTAAPTTAPPTPTSAPPTTAPTLAPGVTPTATPISAPLISTPRPPTPIPTPLPEQPKRGGTLVQGVNEITSFAAWQECCGGTGNKLVADSVLAYKPSNTFTGSEEEIVGRMAYDWSVSKDGLSWTLKLEPNMKAALPAAVGGGFEVVDCEDVAWSIMKIKTGEGLTRSFRARTFAPVTSVECPDPLTAVIRTKTPYGALPGMLAVSINVINPKGYWQDRLKVLQTTVVGSGPWMLQSYLVGEKATWVPNPYYHRLAPDGKPYPYLAKVEMPTTGTRQACTTAQRVGRVHICGEGNADGRTAADTIYKQYKDDPSLKFSGPFRVEDNPEWGGKGMLGTNSVFLQGHFGKAPWNNIKVREALSLALDRKVLCQLGFDSWCIPGAFVFELATPWNLPKEEVWRYPGYSIYTIEENMAKARQILTSLGYELYPSAKALKVDIPGWYDSGPYIQPMAVEMLRRAGFDPNWYTPESQRVLTQVVSGEFDVVEWNQALSHSDPNQVCFEHYYTGSDRNYGRYSNPVADDLCEKMGQEIDRTKRIALARQYHKLILDDHAREILLWTGNAYIHSADLRGIEFSAIGTGNSFGRVEKWWLAK